MKACPYCNAKGPHTPLTTDLGNEYVRCTQCRRRFSPDGEEPTQVEAAAEPAQLPAEEVNTPEDVPSTPKPSKKRNQ